MDINKYERGSTMLAILSAGVAPAFALLSFFYLKDRYSEPLLLILRKNIHNGMLAGFTYYVYSVCYV